MHRQFVTQLTITIVINITLANCAAVNQRPEVIR